MKSIQTVPTFDWKPAVEDVKIIIINNLEDFPKFINSENRIHNETSIKRLHKSFENFPNFFVILIGENYGKEFPPEEQGLKYIIDGGGRYMEAYEKVKKGETVGMIIITRKVESNDERRRMQENVNKSSSRWAGDNYLITKRTLPGVKAVMDFEKQLFWLSNHDIVAIANGKTKSGVSDIFRGENDVLENGILTEDMKKQCLAVDKICIAIAKKLEFRFSRTKDAIVNEWGSVMKEGKNRNRFNAYKEENMLKIFLEEENGFKARKELKKAIESTNRLTSVKKWLTKYCFENANFENISGN